MDWKRVLAMSGLPSVVVILLLVFWMTNDSPEKNFSVILPGGHGIELMSSDAQINSEDLLEKLFSDEYGSASVEEWIAKKNYFHIENPELASALREQLCDPFPEGPFVARSEAKQRCAEKSVAKALRELSRAKGIPFHHVELPVRVGIPEAPENRPPRGKANTCNSSLHFLGRQLLVVNTVNEKSIEVFATGRYPCPEAGSATPAPDLQLHPGDAKEIFDGALMKYHEAVATALN